MWFPMNGRHPSRDILGSISQALTGKRIALGVSGSVAAVKSVELAREIMRHGAEVFPVMTPEAERLIHANLLEWATGHRTVTELTGAIEHVALAGNVEGRADLVVIAPGTANTIGKIACGIDDTPVTTLATTALGEGVPILLVPAMHEPMYNHPLVRRNLDTLRDIGVQVMMPRLAEGKAKIPETADIVAQVLRILEASPAGARYAVFFSVAAVGDWRPTKKAARKLQTVDTEHLTLELEPTPKIVDGLAKRYPDLYVVAFRAQHGLSTDELIADARARMERAGTKTVVGEKLVALVADSTRRERTLQ